MRRFLEEIEEPGLGLQTVFSPRNVLPTFVWEIPLTDRKQPERALNQFSILVFDNAFKTLARWDMNEKALTIRADESTAEWSPSPFQWAAITSAPGEKHWVIVGYENGNEYLTGGYWGHPVDFSVVP